MLLGDAGKIAGSVDQRDQGNVEGVAEADKAGGLVRGIDVEDARHHLGLIGDMPTLLPASRAKQVTMFWA